MRVVCILFSSPIDPVPVAEIFFRYSPQIMIRSRSAIFIEIGTCKSLYSENDFLKMAQLILNRMNLSATIRVADDLPTSLCLAIYKRPNKESLPIEALRDFHNPLLKENLQASQLEKMIQNLSSLGFCTLRDFLKIPGKELSNRFGAIGLLSQMKVNQQIPFVWETFIPPEQVSEKFAFDLESPADNLESIYFPLRSSLDRIVLRLRGRGKRLKQFTITFKQDVGNETSISVLLQAPYISSKTLFQITKEKIEAQVAKRPFSGRIEEFQILVTEDTPYFMNQKDLFNPKKEEQDEAFYQFVSRVSTRMGPHSVFFAKLKETYLPEKNWQRQQTTDDAITDRLPERPLRLFAKPIPVRQIDNKIICQGIYEDILSRTQKEVILADWWQSPKERIYTRITTTSGKDLWVYKSRDGEFLHGVFD